MTTRVTWAAVATTTPMGQQVYERQIQREIQAVADPAEFTFRSLSVTSMRSAAGAARRVPMGALQTATPRTAWGIGLIGYRTRGLVHRFDLRLPPHPGREVVTVHDLPPMRFDDEGSIPASGAAGARRSRAIIVPSGFAAREIVELLGVDPDRIHVIPYGLTRFASKPATDDMLANLGMRPPFLMHAAGATTRKNLRGLSAAWKAVTLRHPELTLVLAGPADPRRDLAFAEDRHVVKTGRLPAETVAALMQRAKAVIVPSIYEGFGLPALEGMSLGVPVVAANCGALPEVCADGALLCEPDGSSIAAAVDRVLGDQSLRDRLQSAGPERAAHFSWRRAAESHLDVYRLALS